MTPQTKAAEVKPKRKRNLAYGGHIVATPGVRSGKPRIAGRRIAVADVAFWHLRQGRAIDEIAREYDLTHAQIHAAITYYYDHRTVIDQREAADEAAVEILKSRHPSKLQTKLNSRD